MERRQVQLPDDRPDDPRLVAPRGINSSRLAAAQVTWSRSGRRSRTSDGFGAGAGVVAGLAAAPSFGIAPL